MSRPLLASLALFASSPTVAASRRLYLSSADGRVTCFDEKPAANGS